MGTHVKFEHNLPNEIWKDVVGYEGYYEVSNFGRVKSLPKQRGRIFAGSYLLSQKIHKDGYLCVTLQIDKNKKYPTVHRIVAMAFHSNPDNKRTVNHIDGNKKNNNENNLEWNTHKENIRHAWDIGLSTSHIPVNIKLSNDDCISIRKIRVEEKKTYFELADMFGVSFGYIGRIIKNKKRHVEKT